MATAELFLLDTCTCIFYLQRRPLVVRELQKARHRIYLCTPVLAELYRGASQIAEVKGRAARLLEVAAFAAAFPVLPVDVAVARAFGSIHGLARGQRKQLSGGEMDRLIAVKGRSGMSVALSRCRRQAPSHR